MRLNTWFGASLLALALCACGGPNSSFGTSGNTTSSSSGASQPAPTTGSATPTSTLSLTAQVGQKLFFDQNLSGSGKMSCATCHDPNAAYAPSNNLAVQLGGPTLNLPGTRAVPSLRYKNVTPAYADLLDNPDGVSVPGPGGGFTADGRVDTLAQQAAIPLLSPIEMANANAADVVNKIKAASYASLLYRHLVAMHVLIRLPHSPTQPKRCKSFNWKMSASTLTPANLICIFPTNSAAHSLLRKNVD